VTQIRSPVLLVPCFFWFTQNSKDLVAAFLAIGRELLITARVLIATRRRAEMHDLTANFE
jgi:hypothetical protein